MIRQISFPALWVLGLALAPAPAWADDKPTTTKDLDSPAGAADSSDQGSDIIVTARNRSERLQDVPIPITVITGEQADRLRLDTIKDFTLKVPNLLVNAPNARQSSLAIRGLGKNTANDGMEASVGLIVDDVFAGHVGLSWVNYVDVDRIELLRGPQGTLLGKNTTLGVLNITTKGPSFTPGANVEVLAGNRSSIVVKGAITGPVIDDKLAYRLSVYYDKSDGFLDNLDKTSEHYLGTNRGGARLQLLATPSSKVSARIIAEYYTADERINVKPSLVDPKTFADGAARTPTYTSRLARGYFGGYQPIIGSFDVVDLNSAQPLKTSQYGLSAEITAELGRYTLSSISAFKALDFDAKNDTDLTRFDIMNYNGTLLHTRQLSQEIRLASPSGGPIDYQVGLYGFRANIRTTGRNLLGPDGGAFYASNAQYNALMATPQGQLALRDSLSQLYIGTYEHPTTTSFAAFGQANWHVTDRATLTVGIRDTYEIKDSDTEKFVGGAVDLASRYTGTILTNAQAIRDGRTKTIYGLTPGLRIKGNSVGWLVSPNYKISDHVMLYASVSHGEKSGAVQFDADTGAIRNVDPEKVMDYELGIKSSFWGGRATLNVNLYDTEVSDYQAQLSVQRGADILSYLGNVGKVRMRGVELESSWQVAKPLTLSLSGAYNDAIYKKFADAPCAVELSDAQAVCDLTGRTLQGASKWTINGGFDYAQPIGSRLEAYFDAAAAYRSQANLNSSLSVYGIQPAYTLVNGSLGLRGKDGRWDVSLWVKNLLDAEYFTDNGAASGTAAFTFTADDRRSFGIALRTRL